VRQQIGVIVLGPRFRADGGAADGLDAPRADVAVKQA
jgi:hypothetical protein